MASKKKPNKAFKDWQAEEVEKTFGITKKRTLPILETLKKVKLPENHELRETLETYRLEAFDYIESWNEDEYKFMFISPFFRLLNLVSPHYKAFIKRPLSINYENDSKIASGNVGFMLAKGRQILRYPYHFLQEYKPETAKNKKEINIDFGQLLIAMVAAQKLNQDDKAIYGIYVNGRNWFLVALEGKKYATSLAYDVTSDRIFDLFAVLLFFKQEMETLYSQL